MSSDSQARITNDLLLSELLCLSEQARVLPDDTLIELQRLFKENPELEVAANQLIQAVPSESPLTPGEDHSLTLTPPSTKIGLVFDFDETLTKESTGAVFMLQQGAMVDELGRLSVEEQALGTHSQRIPENVTLRYLQEQAPDHGITREDMAKFAKTIELARGLEGPDNFFDRMRAYGKKLGVEVQFHMASANLYDIPANSKLAPQFDTINGKRLLFDPDTGFVNGVAQSVDFTTKARMLSEISKGLVDKNATEGLQVNRVMPAVIPLNNMIVVGDGETDISMMSMVREHGGKAIGVFNPDRHTVNEKALREDEAVDHILPRDYSRGSELEEAFKGEIRKMSERIKLQQTIFSSAQSENGPSQSGQSTVDVATASPKELLNRLIELGDEAETQPAKVNRELDKIFDAKPEIREGCEQLLGRLNDAPDPLESFDKQLHPPVKKVALLFDFDETVTDHNSIRAFFASKGVTEETLKEVADAWKAKGVHAGQIGEKVDTQLLPELGVTKEDLQEYGKTIPLSKGLTGENNFFDRMRAFAKDQGLELECHLVSANLTDMISASGIAQEMDSIQGMRMTYDPETGVVNGCAEGADFTVKTRMVDTIAKGLTHASHEEDSLVYRRLPEVVPIKNMIAVADGKTDIAYMSYTKQHGGSAIGVYDEPTEIAKILKDDQRTDHLEVRDYSAGTPLEKAFQGAILKVAERVRQEETVYNKRLEERGLVMPSEGKQEGQTLVGSSSGI